jgi:hypothetical protein
MQNRNNYHRISFYPEIDRARKSCQQCAASLTVYDRVLQRSGGNIADRLESLIEELCTKRWPLLVIPLFRIRDIAFGLGS